MVVSDTVVVVNGLEPDLVAEVMVEKAQYEIEAPVSGRIRIAKEEDEVVSKGTLIATLEA